MKRTLLLGALFCTLGLPLYSLTIHQGIALGYSADVAGIIELSFQDLSQSVPIEISLQTGLSYQFDSGEANEARQIFINDNQGGTVEKYGVRYLLGLDLSYRVLQSGDMSLHLYLGPRANFYNARYTFVGDNEDFVVRNNSFGAGGGLKALLKMGEKFEMFLRGGASFSFPATLQGHGQFYYTPQRCR